MQRSYIVMMKLAMFFAMFCLIACSKSEPADGEIFVPRTYERGEAEGVPVQQSIGAGGGVITSADGKFKLELPAGALGSSSSVSIQTISNTLPLGAGAAYRVLPADIKLLKPAVISFLYNEAEVDGLDEDALDLATQDQSGVWKRLKRSQLNKANRVLRAEVKHLGDFSFTGSYRLVPVKAGLGAGEKTQLMVYTIQEKADGDEDEEAILGSIIPVTGSDDLDNWQVSGPGSIITEGSAAEFTAPPAIDAGATVEIAVTVKNVQRLTRLANRQLRLRKMIHLAAENFMAGFHDGQPFTCIGVSVLTAGGITTIQGITAEGKSVLILVNGTDVGSYPYGSPSQAGQAEIRCNISGDVYETVYTICGPPLETRYASGSLRLGSYQSAGGEIAGDFSTTLYDDSGCQIRSKTITGSFGVKS